MRDRYGSAVSRAWRGESGSHREGHIRHNHLDVLIAHDCPRCAARDAVRLENGEYFCPWCLNAWSASSGLILDRDTGREQDFLVDLARAFEQD